jgi:hypothetical protein
MTTLALLNGKKYDIKETADQVTREIDASIDWIRLTLVRDNLSSKHKEEQCRFMKAAIAYWY